MDLWILFTLAAAGLQTTRFVLQKRLAAGALSTAGATFARFLFAAPLACGLAAAGLALTGTPIPLPGPAFFLAVAAGGVAQIVATDLTVRLFGLRNFTVGVAFTKTETVDVAIFSALILGEVIPATGWAAIGLGLLGVLLISRGPEPGAPVLGRAALYGLAAGALFGIASVGYRAATLALEPAPFLLRALIALAAATLAQTVVMALWLSWKEPGEIGRVVEGWRRTALVGLTGMLGSLCWFAAFALQSAAYVRALGQVEMVFTLAASVFLFRERLRFREAAGIALVVLSLVGLVFAAG
ncbi:MAG: EamA family transporter [Paracoccaceae bacterium]